MNVFSTLFLFLFSITAVAQRGGLKLKVKDEQNFNLPGASVAVSPGRHGGTTNQSGELLLTGLPQGDYTIVISYIGFETAEKTVSVGNSLQEQVVTLPFRAALSQEVVVTRRIGRAGGIPGGQLQGQGNHHGRLCAAYPKTVGKAHGYCRPAGGAYGHQLYRQYRAG